MGEAKRRAERRREAREKGVPFEPQPYAPQVPQKITLTALVDRMFPEQIDRRLQLTDFQSRDEFIEKLLEAGITWFDFELDQTAKQVTKEGEPKVQLATQMPPGADQWAKNLQAIKSGAPLPGTLGGGPVSG